MISTMLFHTDTEQKIDFSFENGQVTLYGDLSSVIGKDFIFGFNRANPVTPYYFKLMSHIPRINQEPLFNGGLSIGVEYYIENADCNQRYDEIIFSFPVLDHFLAKYLMHIKIDSKQEDCHEDEYQCTFEDYALRLKFYAELENLTNNYKPHYVGKGKLRVSSDQAFDADFAFQVVERIRQLFSFIYKRLDVSIGTVRLNGFRECLRPKNIGKGNDISNQESYTKPMQSILCPQEAYDSSSAEFEDFNPFKDVDFSILKDNIRDLIQKTFEDKIVSCDIIHVLDVNYRFEYYFRLITKDVKDKVVIKGEAYDVQKLDKLENKLFYIINPDYLVGTQGRVRSINNKGKPCIKGGKITEIKKQEVKKGNRAWNGLEIILNKYLDEPYCSISLKNLLCCYIKIRDSLAHGLDPYESFLKDRRHSIHSIRLVDCINYCLVLKLSHYSDKKISDIIDNYWFGKLSILKEARDDCQ